MSHDTFELHYEVETYGEPPEAILAPKLRINGAERGEDVTVDIEALLESTRRSGEFYIFTCGCGEPACARIDHGIIVLHDYNSLRWLIPEPFQRRFHGSDALDSEAARLLTFRECCFDPQAYREAIAAALAQARQLAESMNPPPEVGPYGFTLERLFALKVG